MHLFPVSYRGFLCSRLDVANGFRQRKSFFKKAPEMCRRCLHCLQGSDGNMEDGELTSLTRYIYIFNTFFLFGGVGLNPH
jgi:hypothetical protein